jgi:CubicO group peptidase (beta-lactamase class C family)
VARAGVLGLAVRAGGRWEVEVGAAGSVGGRDVDDSTPFDLASVSKSFIACCFARLWQRGAVTPETELGALVDECRGSPSEAQTLQALLSHRAGLEPHRALYAPLERGRPVERAGALRLAANARRPDLASEQGPQALYSDLGYLLAGEALARASGQELDVLVRSEIAEPLGIQAGSSRQWSVREVAFRGGDLRGVVHDENAWAFAGHRAAGQAGLFASVHDVLTFGVALLDALSGRVESWLLQSTAAFLLAPRAGGTWRLGFDGKSEEASSAGQSASPRTFGHLGFTGTSFWCDPLADVVTVLLTNRVFPTRANVRIRACRPVVHEALFKRARERSEPCRGG